MDKNLTYTQYGDYYIPDIRLEHTGTQTLGKYGRMRISGTEQTDAFQRYGFDGNVVPTSVGSAADL